MKLNRTLVVHGELKNQTLVAAEAAKQMGFEYTYAALLEIVRELESSKGDAGSITVLSRT
jgi:hypothetical protein